MDATKFDLDRAVAEAFAAEQQRRQEAADAEAARKEAERRLKNGQAETLVVEAMGYAIASALAPITGDGVGYGHARFSYKGVDFDMWKADRSSDYGIQMHVSGEYGPDPQMTFVDAPQGVLAYIGRMTITQRREAGLSPPLELMEDEW